MPDFAFEKGPGSRLALRFRLRWGMLVLSVDDTQAQATFVATEQSVDAGEPPEKDR